MEFSDKDMLFTKYLFAMSDDTGILQHSIYGVPDPKKGYTTDDNSRALILAVMLFERFMANEYLMLIYKYIAFMLNAQNYNGRFKNFLNYNREFREEEGSEDCLGRCLWALGRTISSPSIPANMKKACRHMLNKILENWPELESPRAKAYAITGLSFLDCTEEINSLIEELSMSLVKQYRQYRDYFLKLVEDSPVKDNILILRGQFPQKTFDTIISAADVSPMPYLLGAQSGIMAHCFAFAKPVVVSPLPAFMEAIDLTGGGIVADSNEEFASAIIKLLKDEKLSAETSAKIRQYVKKHLNWEKVAEETMKVYREITNVPYGRARYLEVE